MIYWNSQTISNADVIIPFSNIINYQKLLMKVKQALDQYGLAVVKEFCSVDDSMEDIKEKCYDFGLAFGFFNPSTPYFYDVYDRGIETYNKSTRYSDTNLSHGPHTDGTKKNNFPRYIILHCVEQAEEGGINNFINALSVRKVLENHYPNVINSLLKNIIRDMKDSDSNDIESILNNSYPIYLYDKNYNETIFRYMRRWIDVAYEKINKPMSVELKEALNTLDSLLNNNLYTFSHKLDKGDLVISDNYFLAHDRTKYKDTFLKKRYMLRAWIYDNKDFIL